MSIRKVSLALWTTLLLGSVLVACQTESPVPTESVSVLPTPGTQAFTSPITPPSQSEPSRSFDGKIAFHSEREGSLQIYVLQSGVGEAQRLTTDPWGAFEPNWSPDCQSIVFTSKRDNPNSFEIYTMRSDGSEQVRLFSHQPEDDWSPAWSPVEDKIAYQTNPMGQYNICFASSTGESQGCLEGEYHKASPAWSPDGSKILFTSDRDGDWEIYVTDVQESSEPVQLTNNDFQDLYPQFSPDGQSIVFSSKHVDIYHIFIMNVDGSGETQLTVDGVQNTTPRWVGNDRIVYASLRVMPNTVEDWDLYLMDRDGGNEIRLTGSDGLDKWPVWCANE